MKNNIARFVALFAMLVLGYWLGTQALARAQVELNAMTEQWQQQRQAYQALREQHGQLHTRLMVQSAEIEALKSQVDTLTQKNVEQSQRLAFYRNVMAPESTQDGFIIDGLQIKDSLLPNTYRLSFVALQQRQQKAFVSGTFAITLSGSLHHQPHQLHSEQHDLFIEGSADYRFKYFQVMELTLRLPQDFVPERVGVSTEVYQSGRRRGVYQSEYVWLEVIDKTTDE